ncbi:telomere length regulation protein tel2 family member [Anaeramoeba flamelloides]|uniref:Telomere length regulation protein tel2 family member n=1 Tax=Anaeramoeba flamelloides TaxID=1746091 RepID=A0ABQ8ZBR7_9EUKA|nr:telomere length regulation protein tel2 family member [Anaeramoeba flamelloides]
MNSSLQSLNTLTKRLSITDDLSEIKKLMNKLKKTVQGLDLRAKIINSLTNENIRIFETLLTEIFTNTVPNWITCFTIEEKELLIKNFFNKLPRMILFRNLVLHLGSLNEDKILRRFAFKLLYPYISEQKNYLCELFLELCQLSSRTHSESILTLIVSFPTRVFNHFKSHTPKEFNPESYFLSVCIQLLLSHQKLITSIKEKKNENKNENEMKKKKKSKINIVDKDLIYQFYSLAFSRIIRLSYSNQLSSVLCTIITENDPQINESFLNIFQLMPQSALEKILFWFFQNYRMFENFNFISWLSPLFFNNRGAKYLITNKFLVSNSFNPKLAPKILLMLQNNKDDEEDKIYYDSLLRLFERWGSENFIQSTTREQWKWVSAFIKISLNTLNQKDLESYQLMNPLLSGIQHHFQNPNLHIRKSGMRIAQQFSKIMDPDNVLDFGINSLPSDEDSEDDYGYEFDSESENEGKKKEQEKQQGQEQEKKKGKEKEEENKEKEGNKTKKESREEKNIESKKEKEKEKGNKKKRKVKKELDPDQLIYKSDSESDFDDSEDSEESEEYDDENFNIKNNQLKKYNDSEESDDLIEYDINDDESDLKEIVPPIYLRNCVKYLHSETEDVNKLIGALRGCEPLIRKRPDDLFDVAEELIASLLHLSDMYNIENFDQLRLKSMIALGTICIKIVIPYLTNAFYNESLNVQQRIDILNCLMGCSLELAGYDLGDSFQKNPNNSDNYKQQIENINNKEEEQNGNLEEKSEKEQFSFLKKLSERRWGYAVGNNSQKKKLRGAVNKFAKVVGLFFFPIAKCYDSKKNKYNLLGEDSLLLGKLIQTFATFIEAAGPNARVLPKLSRSVLELLWVLRFHKAPFIRSSILFTIYKLFSIAPTSLLEGEIVELVTQFRLWVADETQNDPDNDCRGLAALCLYTFSQRVKD